MTARAVTDRPQQVVGPMGEMLTIETLPPPATSRWTVHRKAEIVAAVRGGLLTFDEACARYSLGIEELSGWLRAVERSGIPGLRITWLQHYREQYERRDGY